MKSKPKTSQGYQSGQGAPQSGGGVNRQSAPQGPTSVARPYYQEGERRQETGSRSSRRNGARGR